MLEHTGWLRHRLADEYWTVVAQNYEYDYNGFWFEKLRMTSVLAPVVAAENLLADHHHLTTDAFEDADASGGGQTGMRVGENVTIEPFAMRDTISNRFDITNDFVQFYDLRRLDTKTYVAVDSACEDVDVVRIVNDVWRPEISVSTRFLRNYLACKGRVLVRQHDNFVRLKRESSDLGTKYFPGSTVGGPGYAFRREVDWSDDLAASRLIGKDLVMPFRERRDPLAPQGERCEFVIGIDDQGMEVTATYRDGDEMCGVAAGNGVVGPLCERPAMYPGEDGMCKYCFPVRFRHGILKKYLESDRHEVDGGEVSCAQWNVWAHINDSGIVSARLGDLARLPACEQHHWRSYNVPPEGIGGRQYAGFGSMIASAHGVGYGAGVFWKSFNNFQEKFERVFGFVLFKPLSDDDKHRVGGIRAPLSDDQVEFERCIQNLAILLNETIDVEQLRKKLVEDGPGVVVSYNPYVYVKWFRKKFVEHVDRRAPRQIQTLRLFLEHESLPTTIIPHLLTIQKLRSSGVSHPKGSKFRRIARKYKLNDVGRSKFVSNLLADIARELDATLPDTERPRAS